MECFPNERPLPVSTKWLWLFSFEKLEPSWYASVGERFGHPKPPLDGNDSCELSFVVLMQHNNHSGNSFLCLFPFSLER